MSVPKLTEMELQEHLQKLPGWSLTDNQLVKEYQFKNFVKSLQFVNQVGETAESINHHPDIDIRYSKVTLQLTTHDSGGITLNDVELAAMSDDSAEAVQA